MINPKLLLEQTDRVRENLVNRGREDLIPTLDEAIRLYEQYHTVLIAVEQKRALRNKISANVPSVVASEYKAKIGEARAVREELVLLDEQLHTVRSQLDRLIRELPNLALDFIPKGDAHANQEIGRWGEPKSYDFPIKDHVHLGTSLGLLDIERAAKVSGSRFAYLMGDAVLLAWALIQIALKKLLTEGFVPVIPPVLIKQRTTQDLGYWHSRNHLNYYLVSDEEELDRDNTQANPLYLVGTSEHAIVPMHSDEVFETKALPKRYVGYSSCFRREAGSYGKDVRGILRVHQFEKVEMVSFCTQEQASLEFEKLIEFATSLMQTLGLPYRLVELATGDLSFPAARTVDIETWIPSQNTYRETHSISTATDYQARRLNTRYKKENGTEFVHILNGTAFAIGRIIIALLENYQQSDGSVVVPEPLREYLGKDSLTPV